jgi:hypothetical protein
MGIPPMNNSFLGDPNEPIHVSYYQCPYCHGWRGKRNYVWNHMNRCLHSPDIESCPPHVWIYSDAEYGGKWCDICKLNENGPGR